MEPNTIKTSGLSLTKKGYTIYLACGLALFLILFALSFFYDFDKFAFGSAKITIAILILWQSIESFFLLRNFTQKQFVINSVVSFTLLLSLFLLALIFKFDQFPMGIVTFSVGNAEVIINGFHISIFILILTFLQSLSSIFIFKKWTLPSRILKIVLSILIIILAYGSLHRLFVPQINRNCTPSGCYASTKDPLEKKVMLAIMASRGYVPGGNLPGETVNTIIRDRQNKNKFYFVTNAANTEDQANNNGSGIYVYDLTKDKTWQESGTIDISGGSTELFYLMIARDQRLQGVGISENKFVFFQENIDYSPGPCCSNWLNSKLEYIDLTVSGPTRQPFTVPEDLKKSEQQKIDKCEKNLAQALEK